MCPEGKLLQLNYCLYGAKQAPACFKKVLVDFLLSLDFKPANDANTVFIKSRGLSKLICACFVDDILHLTNDVSMYRDFRKAFEKRFTLKAHDQVDLYLGNRIVTNRFKRTVSLSQKHYILSCLDKFGLDQCNGVDRPMISRLSAKDQSSDSESC